MAPIPANINIDWISNYAGPHRVCYRIQGSGSPYTCTSSGTHPNCTGGGTPCSYTIPITVDNETCDVVTIEGYVQPACEDEASDVGRVAFSVTFTPDPACKKWDLSCDSNGVDVINIDFGGNSYVSVPNVTITGDGTGATATATLTGDVVTGITVNTPGTGYTTAPTVLIDGPAAGETATATAVLLDCGSVFVRECDTVTPRVHPPIPVGESIDVCFSVQPTGTDLDDYTITEDGNCLCDCESFTFSTDVDTVNLNFYNCTKQQAETNYTLLPGAPLTVCVAANSLSYVENGGATLSITNNGSCTGA